MANPVVEDITTWRNDASTNDTNLPTSGSNAGTGQSQDLAGNLRLLKSEMRKLSLTMSWERWLGVKNLAATADVAFSFIDATHFAVNDNFVAAARSIALVGRRILAIGSGGTFLAVGTISAASFSSPNTVITAVWDSSGSIDATLVEIQFGLQPGSLPQHKSSHASGGSDAFLSTDLIEAGVRRCVDDTATSYRFGNLGLDEPHVTGNLLVRRSADNVITAVAFPLSNAFGVRNVTDIEPGPTDGADGDIWYVHD